MNYQNSTYKQVRRPPEDRTRDITETFITGLCPPLAAVPSTSTLQDTDDEADKQTQLNKPVLINQQLWNIPIVKTEMKDVVLIVDSDQTSTSTRASDFFGNPEKSYGHG